MDFTILATISSTVSVTSRSVVHFRRSTTPFLIWEPIVSCSSFMTSIYSHIGHFGTLIKQIWSYLTSCFIQIVYFHFSLEKCKKPIWKSMVVHVYFSVWLLILLRPTTCIFSTKRVHGHHNRASSTTSHRCYPLHRHGGSCEGPHCIPSLSPSYKTYGKVPWGPTLRLCSFCL